MTPDGDFGDMMMHFFWRGGGEQKLQRVLIVDTLCNTRYLHDSMVVWKRSSCFPPQKKKKKNLNK